MLLEGLGFGVLGEEEGVEELVDLGGVVESPLGDFFALPFIESGVAFVADGGGEAEADSALEESSSVFFERPLIGSPRLRRLGRLEAILPPLAGEDLLF